MTAEEVLNSIVNNVVSEDDAKVAIETIKAYAREMCDKQKEECVENMSDTLPIFAYREVKDTPYPKELQ